MTVKELIERLLEVENQEKDVVVVGFEDCGITEVYEDISGDTIISIL